MPVSLPSEECCTAKVAGRKVKLCVREPVGGTQTVRICKATPNKLGHYEPGHYRFLKRWRVTKTEVERYRNVESLRAFLDERQDRQLRDLMKTIKRLSHRSRLQAVTA